MNLVLRGQRANSWDGSMPEAQNKKTPALADRCAGAGVVWGYIWLPELSWSGRSGSGQVQIKSKSGPNQSKSLHVRTEPNQQNHRTGQTEPNQQNRPPEQTNGSGTTSRGCRGSCGKTFRRSCCRQRGRRCRLRILQVLTRCCRGQCMEMRLRVSHIR